MSKYITEVRRVDGRSGLFHIEESDLAQFIFEQRPELAEQFDYASDYMEHCKWLVAQYATVEVITRDSTGNLAAYSAIAEGYDAHFNGVVNQVMINVGMESRAAWYNWRDFIRALKQTGGEYVITRPKRVGPNEYLQTYKIIHGE